MDDSVKESRATLAHGVKDFPTEPGVYLMKDQHGKTIYVGKAKSLRNRVRSYFTGEKDVKTAILMRRVRSIDYIVTRTEYEALLLENNLIKESSPRYNINLKDGKTYPVIRITADDYPRVFRTRRVIQDGSDYFGPYPDVHTIDQYLELIDRLFPLRKCRGPLKKREKPCLYYHIGRCAAPCAGKTDKEQYNQRVDAVRKLLRGESADLVRDLRAKMDRAVKKLNFEEAARLRDDIAAITNAESEQQVVDFDPNTRDYIGFAREAEAVSFVVFQMRSGKLTGTDVFRESTPDAETEDLEQFLLQYYSNVRGLPSRVVVPVLPNDAGFGEAAQELLGREVPLSLPETDHDIAVVNMVTENAKQDLYKRLRERGNIPALEELKSVLGLSALPRRIEGFDIAQLSGRYPVASMVSFLNGIPDKSSYRRFHLKSLGGNIDDFESMREAVARRYQRLLNEERSLPDLILVDGGKGQVSAARGILASLNLEKIPVVGLAKREEEIFLAERDEPITLPEGSPPLKVLQYVRDEAHRFATSLSKKMRSKNLSFSVLESAPGIGPKRSRLVMEHYGSIEAIRTADVEELAGVGKMGVAAAEALQAFLEKQRAV